MLRGRRPATRALAVAVAVALIGGAELAAASPTLGVDAGADAGAIEGTDAGDEASADAAAQELARRAAVAQERCDAGDFDAAIGLWSALLADVPRSPELAPLRASFLLAIVDAHERAFVSDRDPRRLRVAIELLDRYLGELDPSDDENRVAIESRRRALAGRLEASGAGAAASGLDDSGPRSAPPPPRDLGRIGRRWTIAGGSLAGVGVGGLALMTMGMLLGRQADDDLSAAIARSIVDPGRDAAIDAALADGLRANRIAYAGGIVGGALVVGGIAALLQGARLRARAAPTPGGVGLAWRF